MYNFLKSKSVLYVEDDKDVSNNISKLLSKFFDNFYTAYDGVEALEIFNSKHIDIMLVDIELPRMNGIELIREARKKSIDTKIIIISAYTKTDYLLESVELSLTKYIVKPLTSSKIHNILETINNCFTKDNLLFLCNAVIDKQNYTIKYKNHEYELTKKELQFIEELLSIKLVSYDSLYNIWIDEPPSDTAVRSFIKYLRKKLPDGILKNKSGIGYFLKCEDESKE